MLVFNNKDQKLMTKPVLMAEQFSGRDKYWDSLQIPPTNSHCMTNSTY